MFHGTKVPRERKFSLWSFRSREQKCRGTKRPGIFLTAYDKVYVPRPGRFLGMTITFAVILLQDAQTAQKQHPSFAAVIMWLICICKWILAKFIGWCLFSCVRFTVGPPSRIFLEFTDGMSKLTAAFRQAPYAIIPVIAILVRCGVSYEPSLIACCSWNASNLSIKCYKQQTSFETKIWLTTSQSNTKCCKKRTTLTQLQRFQARACPKGRTSMVSSIPWKKVRLTFIMSSKREQKSQL